MSTLSFYRRVIEETGHADRAAVTKLRSLPVIDAESRVVGMVSRNDLMGAIAPERP